MRVENLYITDNGEMIDLAEVVSAVYGNRDNGVVFVRVRGDVSVHGTIIRPDGQEFLAALREYRTPSDTAPW